jgi:bisphosphoglycerate-independent phosphoglycerate mutase (AlkP superfamily)
VHAGKLADVAPTILKMMDIAQPAEMTGRPLF